MARQSVKSQQKLNAPAFIRAEDKSASRFDFPCELITPMVGGGTKSWQVDLENPVRSQSVKGQLRFWWRTMQDLSASAAPESLKKKEDAIWGATDSAGKVRLHIHIEKKPTKADLLTIEENEQGVLQFDSANLPGYVLFPFQGLKNKLDSCSLLGRLDFILSLYIADSDPAVIQEITNSVKLWILFGGLGARTRRGCGSIYCPAVMAEFHDTSKISEFIQNFFHGNGQAAYKSPYPVLNNCRLAVKQSPVNSIPAKEWYGYLDAYGKFRQGPGIGRNRGKNNRPGRTRWPEADAIRRITGQANSRHEPEHPAGNWFPRGAYGLPIQSEFKNAPGDPEGKFFLQPQGKRRWPSPVFLKVIQLNATTTLRACLILNHAVPGCELQGDRLTKAYRLSPDEAPMSFAGKTMPANADMLHSGENPYDALIRHLGLEEVL